MGREAGGAKDFFVWSGFVITRSIDWTPRVVMLPTLWSVGAPYVVVITTCGAISNNKVGMKTTLDIQCHSTPFHIARRQNKDHTLKSHHYCDITMSAMVSQIVYTKENIKAPRHWPWWRESPGDRWILLTNLANWVSIGSDNSLSPERRQAITCTNAQLLSIKPIGTNFSEILI